MILSFAVGFLGDLGYRRISSHYFPECKAKKDKKIGKIGFLEISVGAEDFGSELCSLKIYLVSPSGIETLAVEFDDSGNVITENVLVNIPQKEEWAIKLAGHYDSGTSISQSNSLTLHFQVAW